MQILIPISLIVVWAIFSFFISKKEAKEKQKEQDLIEKRKNLIERQKLLSQQIKDEVKQKEYRLNNKDEWEKNIIDRCKKIYNNEVRKTKERERKREEISNIEKWMFFQNLERKE